MHMSMRILFYFFIIFFFTKLTSSGGGTVVQWLVLSPPREKVLVLNLLDDWGLSRACMFSLCLCGLLLGTLVSLNSPKTSRLHLKNSVNYLNWFIKLHISVNVSVNNCLWIISSSTTTLMNKQSK